MIIVEENMLLEEVKTIVYIDSGTIKAGPVTLGDDPKLGDIVENSWTGDNLKEIFLGIKRVFGNSVIRIVIADSLCSESFVPLKDFWQKITTAASETGIQIETFEAASKARERHENPMVGLAIKKDIIPVETNISQSFKPQKRKFPIKPLLIGLGIFILIATVAAVLYFNNQKTSDNSPVLVEPVVSKPTTFEIIQEPTPTPTFERSGLKIQILNGSGITGLAGKAKKLLKDKGYEEIETGNADRFDYEETEIQIKEEKNSYLTQLREDLSEEYKVSSESSNLLKDSNSFDVVIILGKQ